MSDDPAPWADQGVAISDSFAAARRMGEKDGLARQHLWSAAWLGELALGVARLAALRSASG